MLYLNQHADAAQAFLALAEQLPPPHQQKMLLQAARAYFNQGDFTRFETTLNRLDRASADPATRRDVLWLQADYLQTRNEPAQLLRLLEPLDASTLPPTDAVRVLQARINALSALNDPLGTLRARAALDPYLDTPEARRTNLDAIWTLVTVIEFNQVAPLMPPPPDDFGGWIELIYFVRYPRITPTQLSEDLRLWQLRYPTHPALSGLDTWLPRLRSHSYESPRKIALLLPLEGRLREYGEMLRDGFVSGYLDTNSADRPIIRVYPLGDDPADALRQYRQALEDGTDFVVGPLDKEAFDQLVKSDEIRTPMIGLNYLSPGIVPPPAVFQFGLLPEDEAAEAARYAWQAGHRNALVLTADNEMGARYATAFTTAFTALGGKVIGSGTYPTDSFDFSTEIVRLLNVNRSTERHRQLVSALGIRLEFEARSRGDVQFIFVYATPQHMRLIRPQLKFHHAGQLPVYSPSRTYTGQPNTQLDADLNGVWFVETPWLLSQREGPLRQQLTPFWNDRFARMGNFFAMGYDAAKLVSAIPAMIDHPDQQHPGLTGQLTLGPNNAIKRQLDQALFVHGVPKVIP